MTLGCGHTGTKPGSQGRSCPSCLWHFRTAQVLCHLWLLVRSIPSSESSSMQTVKTLSGLSVYMIDPHKFTGHGPSVHKHGCHFSSSFQVLRGMLTKNRAGEGILENAVPAELSWQSINHPLTCGCGSKNYWGHEKRCRVPGTRESEPRPFVKLWSQPEISSCIFKVIYLPPAFAYKYIHFLLHWFHILFSFWLFPLLSLDLICSYFSRILKWVWIPILTLLSVKP